MLWRVNATSRQPPNNDNMFVLSRAFSPDRDDDNAWRVLNSATMPPMTAWHNNKTNDAGMLGSQTMVTDIDIISYSAITVTKQMA